jgi:hypothetical protein
VPTPGHELQRADRHLLFLHRLSGARRRNRRTFRRLGHRLLRRPRLPHLSRPATLRRIAHRRTGAAVTRSARKTSLPTSARPRKARYELENTHPFMRELWGRYWIFAHNGNLLDFAPSLTAPTSRSAIPTASGPSAGCCRNCATLSASTCTSTAELFQQLHQLTLNISEYGEFNFLLSNGDALFAHASTRLHYIVRQAPFAEAHLNGSGRHGIDFSEVTGANDRVAVIATLPLDRQRGVDGHGTGNTMALRGR